MSDMSPQVQILISYDLPVALAGMFAAVTCALLGNFLVLRRMALMGDAISHAVLPGIVVAFIISGARSSLPMFIGAAASGILTVTLVEIVRKWGRVESGAAMGVVFSALFALGVLLIQTADLEGVDLDADCVLYGQPEYIFWLPPTNWDEFLRLSTFLPGPDGPPRQLITLAVVCVITIAFVALLFKELRIATFDPALATSLGFNATGLYFLLMLLVACAVVAAFEAVGSILVIAMLICPAATARLLTDRLRRQVILSAIIAAATSLLGYWLAADAPAIFGTEKSLSAAGMMSATSGAALALTILAAPRYGLIARRLRHLRLGLTVAREDLLAMLWRFEEASRLGREAGTPPARAHMTPAEVRRALDSGLAGRLALPLARRRGQIEIRAGAVRLTERGRAAARTLVRIHRLWETFLVREMGLRPDHVHDAAMSLEHFTPDAVAAQLGRGAGAEDPHGRPIP